MNGDPTVPTAYAVNNIYKYYIRFTMTTLNLLVIFILLQSLSNWFIYFINTYIRTLAGNDIWIAYCIKKENPIVSTANDYCHPSAITIVQKCIAITYPLSVEFYTNAYTLYISIYHTWGWMCACQLNTASWKIPIKYKRLRTATKWDKLKKQTVVQCMYESFCANKIESYITNLKSRRRFNHAQVCNIMRLRWNIYATWIRLYAMT